MREIPFSVVARLSGERLLEQKRVRSGGSVQLTPGIVLLRRLRRCAKFFGLLRHPEAPEG